MKEGTREEPRILAAAEREMRSWALGQEMADRKTRFDHEHLSPTRQHVALSREAGAGGGVIAERVGAKLGWEVLDKNLLDRMAAHYGGERAALDAVDETPASWGYDMLLAWLDNNLVSHERFAARLGRTVAAVARRGHLVVVGRGAQFVLPREQVFAVRLIASEKSRIGRLMEVYNLDAAAARRKMDELDRGRREFVRHFFHQDVDNPHLYDLVLNVDSFGVERAADLIVSALGKG